MAVSDFGTAQLATDALAISGPSGTGGEAFVYSGTTYYGVFNEVARTYLMETTGFKDERTIVLIFPRTSLTAGIPVNGYLYRPFDSSTYQVVIPNGDQQWHDYVLRRPFDL